MVHFGLQQKTAPPNIAEIPNKLLELLLPSRFGWKRDSQNESGIPQTPYENQTRVSVVFIMLGIVETVWFFEATIWVMLILMKFPYSRNPSFSLIKLQHALFSLTTWHTLDNLGP